MRRSPDGNLRASVESEERREERFSSFSPHRLSESASFLYYPQPMHLQECFANLGHRKGEFPHSEKAALTSLALPIYPELTQVQRQSVVEAIAGYFQTTGRLGTRQAA